MISGLNGNRTLFLVGSVSGKNTQELKGLLENLVEPFSISTDFLNQDIMKVKFYGVRGSYPVPGKDTVEFGGNTTCVTITKEIEGKIKRIIIDSGSGIIQLGKEIVTNYFAHKEDLDNIPILFTHHHPDHVGMFPFFAPNFFKNCSLHLYGMKVLEKTIEDILTEQMTPPSFPLEYAQLKSNRVHHVVQDGQVFYPFSEPSIENFTVLDGAFKITAMQAFAPSHPQQGALYYRVEDTETGNSVACIWDNESKIGGDKAVINFSKGANVMIHDTQYTSKEYASDKIVVQGFGHSTYEMAVDNAYQANIQKLYCTHFNPSHTDEILTKRQTTYDEQPASEVNVILAKEGMEFEV